MRAAIDREFRLLLRSPVPWLGSVALAAAAALLMPVNENYYLFWINFDPQGDDQQFERYYTDGIFTYTSGFLVGHLLALLLGAALVLADHSTRRPGGPGASGADQNRSGRPDPTDPARALPAKLIVAVTGGLLLAAVNLAVSLPLASSRSTGIIPDPARVRAAGLSFDPDLLSDSGVRLTIAIGLAAFPLLAAVGVGLGALVGTWSRLFGVLVLWWLAAVLGGGLLGLRPAGNPALLLVVLVLLLPISGHVAITWGATSAYVTSGGHATPSGYDELAAVAVLAGGLGYALLGYRLGAAALRRRLSRPAEQRS